jgi:AraC-like DNA-binding protein
MTAIEALDFRFQARSQEPLHTHDGEALLVYSPDDAFHLATSDRLWSCAPGSAAWVPPGCPSGTSTGRAAVRLRSVHLHPPLPAGLPAQPMVVRVRPLLAALIDELAVLSTREEDDPRMPAIEFLILQELVRASSCGFDVPLPAHPGLRRAACAQVDDLSVRRTISQAAELACMSERSFSRRFVAETGGITWQEWTTELRLLAAVQRLESRVPVSSVAFDVGYESASAFSVAFRRRFGRTPSQLHSGADEAPHRVDEALDLLG